MRVREGAYLDVPVCSLAQDCDQVATELSAT